MDKIYKLRREYLCQTDTFLVIVYMFRRGYLCQTDIFLVIVYMYTIEEGICQIDIPYF